MTDKPAKPAAPKPAAKAHTARPVHKADHAAFKRADKGISKPMRIKR